MQSNRITKNISISVMPDMYNKINDYCAERGCSRSWFMNKAAELMLKESLEDKEDYEIGVKAWKEFEKNKEKISSDDVFAKAGL